MTRSLHAPRILVVDDEQGYRALLLWKLGARGIHVEVAKDGREAIKRLDEAEFNLVITDLTLPHVDGLAVLAAIKKRYPHTEVIVVTGFGTVETAVRAMKLGAFEVIIKPFDLEPFIMTVLSALDKHHEAVREHKKAS